MFCFQWWSAIRDARGVAGSWFSEQQFSILKSPMDSKIVDGVSALTLGDLHCNWRQTSGRRPIWLPRLGDHHKRSGNPTVSFNLRGCVRASTLEEPGGYSFGLRRTTTYRKNKFLHWSGPAAGTWLWLLFPPFESLSGPFVSRAQIWSGSCS